MVIDYYLWLINVQYISSGGYNGSGYNGGNRKEILEFNYETESWTVIGAMKEPKSAAEVSVVSFDDYKKWCN